MNQPQLHGGVQSPEPWLPDTSNPGYCCFQLQHCCDVTPDAQAHSRSHSFVAEPSRSKPYVLTTQIQKTHLTFSLCASLGHTNVCLIAQLDVERNPQDTGNNVTNQWNLPFDNLAYNEQSHMWKTTSI